MDFPMSLYLFGGKNFSSQKSFTSTSTFTMPTKSQDVRCIYFEIYYRFPFKLYDFGCERLGNGGKETNNVKTKVIKLFEVQFEDSARFF